MKDNAAVIKLSLCSGYVSWKKKVDDGRSEGLAWKFLVACDGFDLGSSPIAQIENCYIKRCCALDSL